MCSGRVDIAHLFRAFSNRMDGVFIGGCRLKECNYVTHGNYHALNLVQLSRRIMEHIGLNPDRLSIEFMSSGEGNLFARVVDEFVETIRSAGPIGVSEGINQETLSLNLKAVTKLIPYLRLVESERLRGHFETLDQFKAFYASEEFERLFKDLVADRLAIGQIITLLQEKPLSTGDLSEILGLSPSDISKHLNNTAKQGLVKYQEDEKRFALAGVE